MPAVEVLDEHLLLFGRRVAFIIGSEGPAQDRGSSCTGM
ncbi:unnamed protein product, partial [Amoebophrya sp. A25]|eukprot:GSA25T00005185001.1